MQRMSPFHWQRENGLQRENENTRYHSSMNTSRLIKIPLIVDVYLNFLEYTIEYRLFGAVTDDRSATTLIAHYLSITSTRCGPISGLHFC